MKASAATIKARNPQAARRVADYYTQAEGRKVQLSAEDVERITGYYGAEAAHSIAKFAGTGVAALGFEPGQVASREQVMALLQGVNPNFGTPLRGVNSPGRPPTVSAYDIPLAIEKDATVIGALMGEQGARDLEEALDFATQALMKFLEEDAAVVRRGRNGVVHAKAQGLVAVTTQHFSARPVNGEPMAHAHRHVVVINEAPGPDDRWTALDGERFFDSQTTAGAVAGAAAREFLSRRWGVEWEQEATDKGNLVHRIVGFPEDVRKAASDRQKQIEALEAEGMDNHAAQRSTREAKVGCGDIRDWDAMGSALNSRGVTLDDVMAQCQAGQAQRQAMRVQAVADQQLLTSLFGPAPTHHEELRDWRVNAAKYLYRTERPAAYAVSGYDKTKFDFDRIDRAIAVETLPLDERIRNAMLAVGRRKSTFREHELLRAVVDEGVLLDEAREHVAAFIAAGHALKINHGGYERHEVEQLYPSGYVPRSKDQAVYATAETLEAEARIIEAARQGIGTRDPLCTQRQFDQVLANMARRGKVITPDSDQYAALTLVLRQGHKISLVSGQAGAGKSAGFEALRMTADGLGLLKRDGVQVLGASLANLAAQNLMEKSGIPSMSLERITYRLEHGQLELEPGAIIVVDEASQASTQQLDTLLRFVEEVTGRLICVGDWRQLKSVEAGGLFVDLVKEVPECVAFLNEVRRQKTFEERVVLAVLHDEAALTEAAWKSLQKQSIALYGSTDRLDEMMSAYFRDKKGNPLGPRETVAGALQWYQDRGRVHLAEDYGAAAYGIACQFWDNVAADMADETRRGRALTFEEAQKETLVLARTNEEIATLDEAIVQEGLRRGHFTPDKTITVDGRLFVAGQRLTYRAIKETRLNPTQNLLNGHNLVLEGKVTVTTLWTLKVELPWGATWTVELANTPVPDEVTIELSAKRVAELQERQQQRVDVCKQRLAEGHTPAREKALREARKALREIKSLPAKRATVQARVLESRAIEQGERVLAHLDDGTERYLAFEDFAHTSAGFVGTEQVLQGRDALHSIGLRPGYVALSRGELDNQIWDFPEAAAQAQLIEERDRALENFDAFGRALGPSGRSHLNRLGTQVQPGTMLHDAVGGVSVHMAATPDELRATIAKQIADAYASALDDPSAPRTIAVTRTHEMANDLNAEVLSHLARRRLMAPPIKIRGVAYAVGAPAVVRHDVKSLHLKANDEVLVVGIEKDRRLRALLPSGQEVVLEPSQVAKHLEPGLAVTSYRAPLIDADRFLVVASGLHEELPALHERGAEFYLSDPDRAYQLAVEGLKETAVIGHLVADTLGDSDGSAHRAAWERSKEQKPWEVGIESLRENYRDVAKQLDRYRGIDDPTALAKRRIQDRIIEQQAQLKALREIDHQIRQEAAKQVVEEEQRREVDHEQVVEEQAQQEPRELERSIEQNEVDPDGHEHLQPDAPEIDTPQAAAARAQQIEQMAEDIAKEQEKLATVSSRQPVLDDAARALEEERKANLVAHEVTAEEERKAELTQRLEDIESAIDRSVEMKVHEDMEHPPDYLPEQPSVADGPEALTQWKQDISEIENFRLRWGVPEEAPEPLGHPISGRQEEEWRELSEKLADRSPKVTEALADYYLGGSQEVDGPEMQFSFHWAGDGWTVRGPEGQMPEPGETVTVQKKDGTTTSVTIEDLGDTVTVKGEAFQEASIKEHDAGSLTPGGPGPKASRQSMAQERLAKLIEQRRAEYEARMAARRPEYQMEHDGPSMFVPM